MPCKKTKVLNRAPQIPNFMYFQKSAYEANLDLHYKKFLFSRQHDVYPSFRFSYMPSRFSSIFENLLAENGSMTLNQT